jgi:DNA polymerase-3 subunit alpha
MLFGNDYVSFSKFCRKGLFLMIRGKVLERWGGGDLEFKPAKMELLEELAAKAASITLEVPVDKIDEESIQELENVLLNNAGRTTLRFNLIDSETDTRIQMFSRTRSVTVTQELKSYLQKQTEINFSIN